MSVIGVVRGEVRPYREPRNIFVRYRTATSPTGPHRDIVLLPHRIGGSAHAELI